MDGVVDLSSKTPSGLQRSTRDAPLSEAARKAARHASPVSTPTVSPAASWNLKMQALLDFAARASDVWWRAPHTRTCPV